MERKDSEQMIYLKDLLFAALYRWKTVLAVAAVLAVVLGGVRGLSGFQAMQSSSDQAYLEQVAQYEQAVEIAQQKVDSAQLWVDSHQEYIEDSVLMQLDPRGYYEAQVVLHVQTDYQILPGMSYQNPDRTNTVLGAYETVLTGGDAVQALATVLETQKQYVSELMAVRVNSDMDTVTVSVKTVTQEGAQAVLEVLLQQIQAASGLVADTVAPHTLRILEQTVNMQVDLSLADTQTREAARMTELMSALEAAEAECAALAAPAAASASGVVKQIVIFAVLGAVLGVFAAVCVIWVMHICSNKVYSARTLSNRTGVKTIGCISAGSSKGIDLWLKKLEGRKTGDEEDQLAMIAVDICCRAEGAQRLLVTGSGDTQALAEALRKQLPGVQIDTGSILDSGAALEALHRCDAVVLMEVCGASSYRGVSREAEMICDYKKKLLGCVLIGG